ncbi:MAG: ABC transporter permease [Bacteroidia bacterium]|nr:ABC transporter permease [Bacteroidia bacterium]
MRKIFIVAAREYRVRVRNKWFVVGTLLTPLIFSLFFVIPILSGRIAGKETYRVWVIDPSGQVAPKLQNTPELTFQASTQPLEALKDSVGSQSGIAILVLPADLSKKQLTATFYATKNPSLILERSLTRELDKILTGLKIVQAGIAPDAMAKTELEFELRTAKLSAEGTHETNTLLATGVGYAMAFLVYFMMAIYGQQVMQGVLEEKTNRIVEVIVSAVRPIQLMVGKILGIGAVGITQSLIWVVLITGLLFAFVGFFGPELAQGQTQQLDPAQMAQAERMAYQIEQAMAQFNVSLIFYFLFFFLGGYLIFGSLFGAVGAAVDQPQDASSLSGIIVLPLVLPMLFLTPVLANPNSGIAVWLSLIPYSSPTIMMVRLAATDVPAWQILLSMLLLVGGVYVNGWIAAKVYRVGILLYGKKPTLAEVGRWVVRRA